MTGVKRIRILLISMIIFAVVLVAAIVSVSFAKWDLGTASEVSVEGSIGQFYVEYPYSSSLQKNTYYLEVVETDTQSKYYPMDKQTGKNEEYTITVKLNQGQKVSVCSGSASGSKDVKTIENKNNLSCYTLSGNTAIANENGIYSFYYMVKDNEYEYNKRDNNLYAIVAKELDSAFKPDLTIHFSDGDAKLRITVDDSGLPDNDWGNIKIRNRAFYAYMYYKPTDKALSAGWPGTVVKAGNKSDDVTPDPVTTKEIDAKAYASNNTNIEFVFGHHDDAAKTSNLVLKTDFLKGGVGCYDVTFRFDDYTYGCSGADNKLVSSVDYTEPDYIIASNTGAAVDNVTPVREVNASIAENNGKFIYHNYVCVSRKNEDGAGDNSMAFLEFAVSECNINPYDVVVKSVKITRRDTDTKGAPKTGTVEPAPRIYNYDPSVETRLGPAPSHTAPDPDGSEGRYPIFAHGNMHDVNAGLEGEANDKHMQNHYDDGTYVVLFFGDGAQQYFALDIEIETDRAVDFKLTVSASNINHWQRYESGYGSPWGLYLGGLINDVWSWDPRRTTQMTGIPAITGKGDVTSVKQPAFTGDTTGIDVYYPTNEIDYSITLNLTAGSLVKPYLLDSTGYRRQEDGKEASASTAYLIAKKIIAPATLYAGTTAKPYYNINAAVSNVRDTNIYIPATGEYTFRLKGKVTPGYSKNKSGWYVNLVTGETKEVKDGDTAPSEAQNWYGVASFNFLVDELYISTTATAGTYTVSFDLNGGTAHDGSASIAAQTVAFGGSAIKPADPIKGDDAFDAWYTDEECTKKYDFNSVVTDNITLYANYIAGEVQVAYNLNYDGAPNGGVHETVTVEKNSVIETRPAEPTRAEYVFGGWFTNAECSQIWHFDTDAVTTHTTLYAKWHAKSDVMDGWYAAVDGVLVKMSKFRDVNDNASYGEEYIANVTLAVGNELRFFVNGKATSFICEAGATNPAGGATYAASTVAGDYTLFFKNPSAGNTLGALSINQVSDRTVTFELNGGTMSGSATQTVKFGEKATKPETDPTKGSYVFIGWYKDAEYKTVFDFDSAITEENTTVYAKWSNKEVGFDWYVRINDDANIIHLVDIHDNTDVKAIVDAGTVGSAAVSLNVGDKIYLYTSSATARDITVSDSCNGAVQDVPNAEYVTVSTAGEYELLFDGVNLYVALIVTYEPNGGSIFGIVTPRYVAYNGKLTEPSVPTKNASESGKYVVFVGWYADGATAPFDFTNTAFTTSTTLTAEWSDDAGGWSVLVNANKTLVHLDDIHDHADVENIVKAGTVGGATVELAQGDVLRLYINDATRRTIALQYNCNDAVIANPDDGTITVNTAGKYMLLFDYERLYVTLAVEFELNGGQIYGSSTYFGAVKYGEKPTMPETPVNGWGGYAVFLGWYNDAEYTAAFDFETPITTSTKKAYAKWTEHGNGWNFRKNDETTWTYIVNAYPDSSADHAKLVMFIDTHTIADSVLGYAEMTLEANNKLYLHKDIEPTIITLDSGATDVFEKDDANAGYVIVKADGTYKLMVVGETLYVGVTATFDSKGGKVNGGAATLEQIVARGQKLTEPTATKTGAAFGGWYVDDPDTLFDFDNATITADTTLNAKWLYTVTFDLNGLPKATVTPNTQEVAYQSTMTAPTVTGVPDHYNFVGWYKEKACNNAWTFATDTVTANITLYAKWTADDGVYVNDEYVSGITSYTDVGNGLTKYRAEGLFEQGDKLTFAVNNKMLGSDYAFIRDNANGKAPAYDDTTGASATDIVIQTRGKYVFYIDLNDKLSGGSTNGEKGIWADYVGWTVTINANGGTLAGDNTVTTDGKTHTLATLPATPTAPSGKAFDGWWTAAEGGTEITTDTVFTDDNATIYAHWKTASNNMVTLNFKSGTATITPTTDAVKGVYYWKNTTTDVATGPAAINNTAISDVNDWMQLIFLKQASWNGDANQTNDLLAIYQPGVNTTFTNKDFTFQLQDVVLIVATNSNAIAVTYTSVLSVKMSDDNYAYMLIQEGGNKYLNTWDCTNGNIQLVGDNARRDVVSNDGSTIHVQFASSSSYANATSGRTLTYSSGSQYAHTLKQNWWYNVYCINCTITTGDNDLT